MNDICKNIERKILLNETLTVEEHLHVLDCQSCQNFAEVHQMLLRIKPDAALDAKVLDAASKALPQRKPFIYRHFRLLSYIGASVALIAAIFIVGNMPKKKVPMVAEANCSQHEEILLFYADASEELDAIEYKLASANIIIP